MTALTSLQLARLIREARKAEADVLITAKGEVRIVTKPSAAPDPYDLVKL